LKDLSGNDNYDDFAIGLVEEQGQYEFVKTIKSSTDQTKAFTMTITLDSPIELIHGDAVQYLQTTNEPITHVFMSSLFFPHHVLLALQQLLLEMPSIKMVAALNRLDLFEQSSSSSSSSSWQETDVPIQMSWGRGVVKIYHRM
jgi:hypothetical protein